MPHAHHQSTAFGEGGCFQISKSDLNILISNDCLLQKVSKSECPYTKELNELAPLIPERQKDAICNDVRLTDEIRAVVCDGWAKKVGAST